MSDKVNNKGKRKVEIRVKLSGNKRTVVHQQELEDHQDPHHKVALVDASVAFQRKREMVKHRHAKVALEPAEHVHQAEQLQSDVDQDVRHHPIHLLFSHTLYIFAILCIRQLEEYGEVDSVQDRDHGLNVLNDHDRLTLV